jgi:hypothetical protein
VIIAKTAIRAPLFDPLEEIKEKFDWVIEIEEKCNEKQSTVRERQDRCMQVLDYLYEDEYVDVFLEAVTVRICTMRDYSS